ncbi:hypothetical protein [Salinarimonas sp.]|uniref:hypothetical protein n=1 Tax=Salinarimonas sp. TaxID=2766526 RepID=UPI003918F003
MSPIGSLVRARMDALGLVRADLVARLGYANRAKGFRRVEELCAGNAAVARASAAEISAALEMEEAALTDAIATASAQAAAEAAVSEARAEASWRARFVPHAVWLTVRNVPRPIFVAAAIGVDRLLRVDFVDRHRPDTFVAQARERMPETVIAFGAVTGFAVNYSLARCVLHDREGRLLEVRHGAYRVGSARIHLR